MFRSSCIVRSLLAQTHNILNSIGPAESHDRETVPRFHGILTPALEYRSVVFLWLLVALPIHAHVVAILRDVANFSALQVLLAFPLLILVGIPCSWMLTLVATSTKHQQHRFTHF